MRFAALAALGLLAACEQQAPVADNIAAQANEATANTAAPVLAPPPTKEAALKLMHDRHEHMEEVGKANKAIGRTLKSTSPDLGVIRQSAARIAGLAPQVPSWFPPGTGPDVGKTYAKAEVWQTHDDFIKKARVFGAAASALDAAAKAGELPAIKAAFGDLGKSCKSCHDGYRAEHEH